MMELKDRLELAKGNLKKAENARTVAETEKKNAEAQRQEIVEEMQQHDVTPETIEDEIKKLEGQVKTDLEKVESLIPSDL